MNRYVWANKKSPHVAGMTRGQLNTMFYLPFQIKIKFLAFSQFPREVRLAFCKSLIF